MLPKLDRFYSYDRIRLCSEHETAFPESEDVSIICSSPAIPRILVLHTSIVEYATDSRNRELLFVVDVQLLLRKYLSLSSSRGVQDPHILEWESESNYTLVIDAPARQVLAGGACGVQLLVHRHPDETVGTNHYVELFDFNPYFGSRRPEK